MYINICLYIYNQKYCWELANIFIYIYIYYTKNVFVLMLNLDKYYIYTNVTMHSVFLTFALTCACEVSN